MFYFYTGMAAAMMIAVFSLFQLGINIKKSAFYFKYPTINLENLSLQNNLDREFISMLDNIYNSSDLVSSNQNICDLIYISYNDPLSDFFPTINQYKFLSTYKLSDINIKIDNFFNSCSLSSPYNNNHKIIITPPGYTNTGNFEYYSCLPINSSYCFIKED